MTVRDYFPGWKTGSGLFDEMQAWAPWPKTDVYVKALDHMYFGVKSGLKSPSQLILDFADTDNLKPVISYVLQVNNVQRWARLWNVLINTYDPLNAINLIEEINREAKTDGTEITDDTTTRTGTDTTDNSGTQEYAKTGKDANVNRVTGTNSNTDYSFGFNSGNADKDKRGENEYRETSQVNSDTEYNNKNTMTNNLSSTNTKNLTDKSNQVKDITDTETEKTTLIRKGTAGLQSPQKLFMEEIDLWQWNFFDLVFADMDKILTIPIYRH